MHPYCLMPTDPLQPVLDLLRTCFAPMDGVIDPPSSLHQMTLDALAQAATEGELWVIGTAEPVACVILTPQEKTLYLGKLAVAPALRGQGLARALVEWAMARADDLELPSVTLQTRVELTDNHAAFQRMGFVEIGRTAHEGYARPTSITYRRML